MILDSTTKSIQFVLTSAVATNQLTAVTSWADMSGSTFTPGANDTQTNNTTAVTIVASPSSSVQRQVKSIDIYNADTANATVTVIYNNSSTLRTLVKTTLQPGETLQLAENQWSVIDSGGRSQTATSGNTLAADADVSISSPTNSQVLTYQSSSSKWVNAASTGGTGGPWQFKVEDYGAVGDGIISSGSGSGTSFTDSTITFTSADVGKVIIINQGTTGSNTNPFCGTITAASGSTVTLNGSGLSSTATNAPYIYGTDDASAITSAINAAATYAEANNYHAQVIFGARNYMLASLTQVTSPNKYNTHIPIPVGPQTGRKLVIDLIGIGTGMDAGVSQFWEPTIPNLHGTCLVSAVSATYQPDATYGQQSVIGGPTALGSGSFANTLLDINGITIVCPWKCQQYGVWGDTLCQMNLVDAAYLAFAPVNFSGATVGGPNYTASAIVTVGNIAFSFPAQLNNDASNADLVAVAGAGVGINFEEHFNAGKLTLVYCNIALQTTVNSLSHGATFQHVSVEQCNYALYTNNATGGPFPIFIGLLDLESIYTKQIYDPGSYLSGTVYWACGTASHPDVNGGLNLNVYDIVHTGPGVWSGAPSMPASGTAQQNLAYRDAWVNVQPNGATISAIAVDSTTLTGITSGWVPVPSGHSIKLTYSGGTPTWAWVLD